MIDAITNLVNPILDAIWLVYEDVARRACCKLACPLVDCDSFKLFFLVDVDGLYDVVGAVEYYEGISGNVCLVGYPSVTIVFVVFMRRRRTMIWFPSHRP